jgi:hypothetical protein
MELETRSQEITTVAEVHALLETFLRCACFIDAAFFWGKTKASHLGTPLLTCQIIRISDYLMSE